MGIMVSVPGEGRRVWSAAGAVGCGEIDRCPWEQGGTMHEALNDFSK